MKNDVSIISLQTSSQTSSQTSLQTSLQTLLQALLQNYNEKHEYKDIAIDGDRDIDVGDVDNNEDGGSSNIDSDYEENLFIVFNSLNIE